MLINGVKVGSGRDMLADRMMEPIIMTGLSVSSAENHRRRKVVEFLFCQQTKTCLL